VHGNCDVVVTHLKYCTGTQQHVWLPCSPACGGFGMRRSKYGGLLPQRKLL
jgi:hypothetical protein